ncbi:MAG: YeeE/YedE family protein [Pirellulaceae bacterium]|nr:YeeE/YedE family protein [Pirellulaceae bacterium]
MDFFMEPRWSPYLVGIGIGVLSWLAFLLSDKPLGCSTAFARSAGILERMFRGRKVDEKPYYQQFAPGIDWEWMLVFGILIGALAASVPSGQFAWLWTPVKWADAAGDGAAVRWLVALLGGFCAGFGARWAGGCTSGHGISGTLQLALSSWIAAVGFFVGGIATAMLIFHVILA